MEKRKLEEGRENSTSPPTSTYHIAKLCLIIIVVVALGLLAINQFFGWYYKMELLLSPCDLCEESNPHIEFREGMPMGIPIIEIENIITNNFSSNLT